MKQLVLDKSLRSYLTLAIITILIVGFAWIAFYPININYWNVATSLKDGPSKELTPHEYETAKNKYKNILISQNPKVALAKLREDAASNNSLMRSCHALTHELGQEAYLKYNNFGEAIKYHDEVCNSGYMHGIIENYFSKSADLQTAVNTVCNGYDIDSFIGWECYHGVGHGLMYYTENDLPNSIKFCETYSSDFATSSCVNGVFMENFNTDQKLHPSKYLKANDPFYPCDQQNRAYKAHCYLYAPTYYLALQKNDYFDALRWCSKAESEFRMTCANGVGAQAAKENINNPKLVEGICMSMRKSQISCIAGMVDLYINHYGSTQPVGEICNSLDKSNKVVCNEVVSSRAKKFKI